MLDLSSIPDDVLLARGQYSTVRAAHEDAKKELAKMCGILQMVPSQILRKMQPGDEAVPQEFDELVKLGCNALEKIALQCKAVESLAAQRQELKSKAWTK